MALAACHYGTRPRDFRPAQSPAGALVALRVTGDTADRVGELFSVDSIGITVRAGSLVRVAWSRVFAMDVDKVGRSADVHPREVVAADKRRRLAALSRFPQGLSGELLARVLRELQQDSLIEIARADLDSLARRAEEHSARYTNRRVAIADGYRRIGGDFPGMGEHWVNPNRIQTRDALDASRPSFLSYATIGGQPRLLGFGFIVTTDADSGGVHLPGWPEEWHEHSGLLGDESAGRSTRSQAPGASRVFVLHIWTALPNPDGPYAPDNWTLPFARSGIDAPAHADADAARAHSLTVGGDAFLVAALSGLGLLHPSVAPAVDSTVAAARARAAAVSVTSFRAGGAPEEAALEELRATWRSLDLALRERLGPGVADIMRPPHRAAARSTGPHAHGTPR